MLYTSMLIFNIVLETKFVLGIKQNISILQRSSHMYRSTTVIVLLLASRSGPYDIIQIAFHRATITALPIRPRSKISSKSCLFLLDLCKLGMATGRVRAEFFHTRTRPAGQDPWPEPDPFIKRIFSPGPGPAPTGPTGPAGPVPHDQSSPAQNQKQNFFFERESKQKF